MSTPEALPCPACGSDSNGRELTKAEREIERLTAAPAPHPDTADAERWRHVWQCVRMAQHGAPSFFCGLQIVPTPMALDVRTEFRVSRCGRWNRKRKRYFVERIEIRKPGCWQAGNVLYMHPTLVEHLKQGGKP